MSVCFPPQNEMLANHAWQKPTFLRTGCRSHEELSEYKATIMILDFNSEEMAWDYIYRVLANVFNKGFTAGQFRIAFTI